jgi:DNA invertase Pin-like site-specific DNA recombinase
MPRAIPYIRVSTEDQGDSGLGLESQIHAIRERAAREGWEVGPVYQDECTGVAPPSKRPGLTAALAEIRPGDYLVVAKRDRLGRELLVTASIESAVERQKGRVISAAGEGTGDDHPDSVFMRRIIDAFAEHERLIIRARTKAALAAKSRKGERVGQIPYGKALAADGVHLVDAPAEIVTVARVRQLRDAGLTYAAIAAQLDTEEYLTKGGRKWHTSTVYRIAHRGEAA